MVALDELQALLQRTPVMLQAHPALLAYLPPEVQVIPSATALVAQLDDPVLHPPELLLTFDVDLRYRARLPLVLCSTDPYSEALNDIFATRYDTIATHTLKQREVADAIAQASKNCEIVVLLLVDGLAYRDVRDWPACLSHPAHVLPCLAEGPTLTKLCFPTIIGAPPLAAKLFDLGFTSRVGFSYWNRENNALTDSLFATIHHVIRCRTMADVLGQLQLYLQQHGSECIFAQIVRMGLDVGAHHMRELPPIDALLAQVLAGIRALAQVLAKTNRRARLFVTSDHGILWRSEFEPEIMGTAQGNPRMAHWRDLGQQSQTGLRFEVVGETYYALPYPLLRRPLRIDEAGVHGGISFQESIVPFLSIEVNVC